MNQEIKAIYGMEPVEPGYEQNAFAVGHDGVTKIEFEARNYGDHGIGQFHVFKGDTLFATMMHRAVSEIRYAPD